MYANSSCVSEELYYHRVFMRTDRQPSISIVEPKVNPAEIVALVSHALDYALSVRKVEGWISPYDLGEFPWDDTVEKHFNPDIGDAITHKCAIEESFRIAVENGFDENDFLDFPEEGTIIQYAQTFIGQVLVHTRPVNISFIHALAFTCNLCKIAADNYRASLMSSLTACAVLIFQIYYPFEWIYYDFKHWAFCYQMRHKRLHDGSTDSS